MFGPDTMLLSDQHVIFVNLGHSGALNDAREQGLRAREQAVAELARCVREGDEIGFVAMMERGRGYLAARSAQAGRIG